MCGCVTVWEQMPQESEERIRFSGSWSHRHSTAFGCWEPNPDAPSQRAASEPTLQPPVYLLFGSCPLSAPAWAF